MVEWSGSCMLSGRNAAAFRPMRQLHHSAICVFIIASMQDETGDAALREAADGFFLAAEHGRSDVIKALADHSDGRLDLARIVDPVTGRTPLHVAVAHHKTDALRVLLTAGFPPHIESLATQPEAGSANNLPGDDALGGKRTAYAMAVAAKASDLVFVFHQFAVQQVAMNSVAGLKQLLQAGVPLDIVDGSAQGNSLLHWAVTCRALDAARFLLGTAQASDVRLVDTTNAEGATPLHVACRDGQMEFVRELLHHGADPRCTGTAGVYRDKTPRDMVTSTTIREMLTHYEDRLLVDQSVDLSNVVDNEAPHASTTDSDGSGVNEDVVALRRKHALQLEEKDLLIRQLKSTIESLVVESQEIRKLGEERTVLDYIRKLREEKDVVKRQLEDAEDHIRIQQQQIQELKTQIRLIQGQQPQGMCGTSVSPEQDIEGSKVSCDGPENAAGAATDAAEAPMLQIDVGAPRSQRARLSPPVSSSNVVGGVWGALWNGELEVDMDGEVIMTV